MDFTKKEIEILKKAVEREQAIYSGDDVIPSYKMQLTKLHKKLEGE